MPKLGICPHQEAALKMFNDNYERICQKNALHAIAYGKHEHKSFGQTLELYEINSEPELPDASKLTRKQAINELLCTQVLCNELLKEIDELNNTVRISKTVIAEKNKEIADMKIRHDGFIAGLSHSFKLEAGDID